MSKVNLHQDVSTVAALAGGLKAACIGVAAFGNAFARLGSATERGAGYLDEAAGMLLQRQEKNNLLESLQLDQDLLDLKESFKKAKTTAKA